MMDTCRPIQKAPGEIATCSHTGMPCDDRQCFPPVSTNPKKALGMKKPPMHLVPAAGNIHEAMAFKDGAAKYGPYNWRIDPVDVSTYVAAIQRHLDLYRNGQDYTSDTDVHNLGAIRACCNILLDAEVHGSLIDDRPPAQDLEALVDRFTEGRYHVWLAKEVSSILGREVKGVRTPNGGINLSVPGHQLYISPGNPVDPEGCARVLGDTDGWQAARAAFPEERCPVAVEATQDVGC